MSLKFMRKIVHTLNMKIPLLVDVSLDSRNVRTLHFEGTLFFFFNWYEINPLKVIECGYAYY